METTKTSKAYQPHMETIKINRVYPHTMKKTFYKRSHGSADTRHVCQIQISAKIEGQDSLRTIYITMRSSTKRDVEKMAADHLLSAIGDTMLFDVIITYQPKWYLEEQYGYKQA